MASKLLKLSILFAILLASCEKESEELVRTDVCNLEWSCGWQYSQMVSSYGEPLHKEQKMIAGRERIIAYWGCQENTDEGPQYYTYLYAEFTNGTLASWAFVDEVDF